ncbi:MAG TPA: cytochrome c oxidase subunit 3 [Candidatus Limnocylindria bacterium]|nr:cytochrome c oxidase subunit 3 [Candidatus Limnocylindria bacterium]
MEIPYTVTPRRDTGLYNAKVGIWLFLASEVMLFGALFSSYVLLRVGADKWPHGLLNIPIGTFNTAVLITSSVTVVMAWASLKLHQFNKFKIYMTATILCALAFVGIKTIEYKDKFTHYSVRLADGRTMDGHIKGSPLFWSLKKLKDKNVETIEFAPDAAHGAAAAAHGAEAAKPAAHAAGEHQFEIIKVSDLTYLSAYVPSHNTYFAIYFTLTGLHAAHVIGGALVMTYILLFGGKMWRTQPDRLTNRVEVAGLFWHFVDLVWIFLFPVLYLL